jgi:hypothetical protein
VGEQQGAGLGQVNAAAVTAEQLYAEPAFEQPDLLAQRGLGNEQSLGRSLRLAPVTNA